MITSMPVESPVRGDAHAGFGGRAGETDQPKDRHRAPARPYVFRFNRRTSRRRGLVFYRLVTQCLNTRPLTYETLVLSRRPQRGLRRGPPPKAELAAEAQAAARAAADDVPF